MTEDKGKYNTGIPVEIPTDREEQETAIKEWAEGNIHLEEALRQCIEHGIKTEASCAGHKDANNDPYLSIEITDENRERLFNILQNVFKKRSGINGIDIRNHIERGKPKAELSIHAKPRQKNEIFDLIAEGAKGKIDLEACHPIIQKMMKIEERARQLKLYSHSFGVRSLGPANAVVLLNNTIKMNPQIYNNTRNSINPYVTDSQIIHKLETIVEAMDGRTHQTTSKKGLFERARQSIIERLERDLSLPDSYADLTTLSDKAREEAFIKFGEGNRGLTRFLRTAYEHGAPSMFCCEGHGLRNSYAMLRVTDENLELLQTLGKALSNHGIATDFEDNFQYGRRVTFRSTGELSRNNWFDLASDIMENPERYDSSSPSILYHETEIHTYMPRSYAIKKRLLELLKPKETKLLTEGTNPHPVEKQSVGHSWDLTPEERARANDRSFMQIQDTHQEQREENHERLD